MTTNAVGRAVAGEVSDAEPTAETTTGTVAVPEAAETASVTWSQQAVWDLHRAIEADPTSSALSTFFNLCHHWALDPPLPRPLVAEAIDLVARRHQALRTTFRRGGDGAALQVVTPDARPGVVVHQAREVAAEYGDVARFVDHVREKTVLRPSLAPPARFHVICEGEQAVGVVALIHHLCADSGGCHALARDFKRACADLTDGRPVAVRGPGVQPLDQARWENSPAGHDTSERALAHWRTTFGIPTAVPTHPGSRETGRPSEGVLTSYRLPEVVPVLARRFRLPPGELMLALFAVATTTFTGLGRCRVACLCSNRVHSGLSVCCSYQMAPFVFDLTATETFEDVVRVTRANRRAMTTLTRYDHHRRLAETLLAQERTGHNLAHRVEYNHIAQFAANSDRARAGGVPREAASSAFRWQVGRHEPKPDLLNLSVTGDADKTHLCVRSNTSVLERATMEAFLRAIEDMTTELTREPNPSLARLARAIPRHHPPGEAQRLSRYRDGLVDLGHVRAALADAVGDATPVAVFVECRGGTAEHLVAYVGGDLTRLELHRLRRRLLDLQYEDPGLVVPTWFVARAEPPKDRHDRDGWRHAAHGTALAPGEPVPATRAETGAERALVLAVSGGIPRFDADPEVNLEVSYVECGGRLAACEDVVDRLHAAGYTGIGMADLWTLTPLRRLARRLTHRGAGS